MLGTDIRGIMAEEEEVQRRRQALKSLLSMRTNSCANHWSNGSSEPRTVGIGCNSPVRNVQRCTSRRKPTSGLNSSSYSMRTIVRAAS